MRRRLLALVPATVLAASLYLVDLPLWVEAPGDARSVLPLIAIDGAPTYDSDGRLLLTTINTGRVNLYDALYAGLVDPAAILVSEREIIPPGQTDREYSRVTTSQMDESKIAAVAVALERLTDYPDAHGQGVIVFGTYAKPAEGVLFPGDLIVSADGRPLEGLEELRSVLDETGTESTLSFRVRPVEGGDTRTVEVRPVLGEDQRPIIGISPLPNFPFEVRIESGRIGGPSAGLMWALGVTDLLSSEDLTGHGVVAGTGTVALDGEVGPIGGIALKVKAAELADAETFLLPQANLAEARGAGADIRLVPVSNVEQAVAFLESET